MSLTAHCIVKNEEVFIEAVLASAVDFADKILVFDTGSTDSTLEKIKKFANENSSKVEWQEKGPCDKKRHTQLRQEMIDLTSTDWFMVLDGDEVWPRRTMEEACQTMESDRAVECVMVPFYLCVGDIYHRYFRRGKIEMIGHRDFFYPRFFKKTNGVHWKGDYNEDAVVNRDNQVIFNEKNSIILKNKFWHVTHLRRSSEDDGDYSSGGTRRQKRRLTYFIIGRKIREAVPEPLRAGIWKVSFFRSLLNFFVLIWGLVKV